MGQKQTTPNSVLRTAMETPNYKEKLKFALDRKTQSPQKDQPPESQSCVNIFCRTKSNIKDPEWKKLILKKLDNPSLEYSELLLQVLQKHNTFQADDIYQADVQWVAYNDKEFTIDLLSSFPEQQVENRNTTVANKDTKALISLQDKQDSGSKSVKSLEGPPEEILVHTKDPEWMKTSFDIKASEDREALLSSLRQLKASRKSSLSKKSRLSRTSVRFSNRSSSPIKTYRSHYDNFTLLWEPPSNYGSPQNNKDLYQETLAKYKAVFSTIERHFGLENYIFRKMINRFEEYFAERYIKIIKDFEGGKISENILNKEVVIAAGDVQQFIAMLYETIVVYYLLDKIKQDNLASFGKYINRDNIINFLTSIIFKGRVYTTLFKLYCLEHLDTETQYRKSVTVCKYYKPEDFGIPEEYCLNENTLKHINKIKLEQGNPLISVPGVSSGEANGYCPDRKTTSTRLSDRLEESDCRLFDIKKPYRAAIHPLTELKSMRSPLHKLKSIVEAAEQVSKCIKEFYNGFGMQNENKLDPDQTLSIFMYLVAHSRLENISAHCKIIEKFSTSNVLNSMSGYYAATMGACVEYISEMGAQSQGNSNSEQESPMVEGNEEESEKIFV